MTDTPFDPMSPAFLENPYPSYARLRREHPVLRIPALRLAVLSRHADAVWALQDPSLFSSSAMRGVGSDEREPGAALIGMDPPQHTRVRKLLRDAFTPRRIARFERRIESVAAECIDRFAARGRCELISELAAPLPATLIAEVLGIDAARRDDFRRWSDALLTLLAGGVEGAEARALEAEADAFKAYAVGLAAERRARPRDDAITVLVAQGGLDDKQLRDLLRLLIVAGNETVSRLIGNAVLALLAHPEQLAWVAVAPGRVDLAVEEVLRWDPPVQATLRRVSRPVERRGVRLEAGDTVLVSFGAANRDEACFPDAERFVAQRNTRGHLAFGLGTHFCAGAGLARLEARAALRGLLGALANLRLDTDRVDRTPSLLFRGPSSLPLRFTRREERAA